VNSSINAGVFYRIVELQALPKMGVKKGAMIHEVSGRGMADRARNFSTGIHAFY
jgi:hypothetical protein